MRFVYLNNFYLFVFHAQFHIVIDQILPTILWQQTKSICLVSPACDLLCGALREGHLLPLLWVLAEVVVTAQTAARTCYLHEKVQMSNIDTIY